MVRFCRRLDLGREGEMYADQPALLEQKVAVLRQFEGDPIGVLVVDLKSALKR